MKKIILFRHAKVDIRCTKWLTSRELSDCLIKYDNANVIFRDVDKINIQNIFYASDIVISSELKRSILSAKYFSDNIYLIDKNFNEVELPVLHLPFKLNFTTWVVFLRLLWFLGYSKECESYKDAKVRAKKAAKILINLSEKYNNIILVGHGVFNRLLLKELILKEWKIFKRFGYKNMSFGIVVNNK